MLDYTDSDLAHSIGHVEGREQEVEAIKQIMIDLSHGFLSDKEEMGKEVLDKLEEIEEENRNIQRHGYVE